MELGNENGHAYGFEVQHGLRHAAWTRTFSVDMDMQRGHGHAG
jgi:hypothetical protein